MSKKSLAKQKNIQSELPATRCACCLSWPKEFAMLGIFTPKTGGIMVYWLCPRCAKRIQRNPADPEATKAIEAYLLGADAG